MLETKKLSEKIKRKERSLSYLQNSFKEIKKVKVNYEKKLKRVLINSETIVEEEKVVTELVSSNEQEISRSNIP